MRTDVLDIEAFYDSALGQTTASYVSARLEQAWGSAEGLRVASFGYGQPYLPVFSAAERCLSLLPEGMGVSAGAAANHACLTSDVYWPLPDASMDRVLIVHGLEEAAAPRRLLREVWRVLADDGRLIIVVPNRRGPWAMIETTPFSAGRPYLRVQLDRLLKSAMFTPAAHSSALYFPPLDMGFLLRASRAWERAGEYMWSALAGVTLVEAVKEIAIPAGGTKADVLQPRLLRPATTRRSARSLHPVGDRATSPQGSGVIVKPGKT
ncbi:class I SAM-dependent methyltransferase [Parvularcula sp. IMCC14364]|uniref:class I SAM-dependent methyltransferase n=1 Tax=Parvularcula sp. IMCC14364 TaxID=3067902 RepID=UPI0027407F9C|nr:class I SAM-dependent methyltransferase [Parvularcula sp. IMCC14364]